MSRALPLWAALTVLCAATDAAAEERALRPPFGLAWDQGAIALEEAILGANARIVSRKREAGNGESWQVEGLPQIALRRARFELRKQKLAGIELEYGKDDWNAGNYDGFVKSVRTRLEEKLGKGTVIARRQDSDKGILQTVLGYRWTAPGGSVELVYFAAQDPKNLYRTVSLHYVAPPAAAGEPAGSR
jgi:hypothetical protein